MHSFTMPDFDMPLPFYGSSSGQEDLEKDMWTWLKDSHLIANESVHQHLARTRPWYATACYFPFTDPQHLFVPNRYMAWAFLVDDAFDDAINQLDEQAVAEFTTELIGVSQQTRQPTTSAGRALNQVLTDLSHGRTRHWRQVLGETNTTWLQTSLEEVRASRDSRTLPFNTYLPHRRFGVDEIIFAYLQEHVRGIELPAEVRELPAMTQARHYAAEWIGLYNDIYSADKEIAVGYPHNAVLGIRRQQHCTLQEAVDIIGTVINGHITQFQAACGAAESQVRAVTGDDYTRGEALRVIEGYRHLVRGNFDYHLTAARYTDVDTYLPKSRAAALPAWSTSAFFS